LSFRVSYNPLNYSICLINISCLAYIYTSSIAGGAVVNVCSGFDAIAAARRGHTSNTSIDAAGPRTGHAGITLGAVARSL
jgi:hypothetical protein